MGNAMEEEEAVRSNPLGTRRLRIAILKQPRHPEIWAVLGKDIGFSHWGEAVAGGQGGHWNPFPAANLTTSGIPMHGKINRLAGVCRAVHQTPIF